MRLLVDQAYHCVGQWFPGVVVSGAGNEAGVGRCLRVERKGSEQVSRVGNQAGGRVFLFLHTDDFQRDWHRMRAAGVRFREEPREESYGTVAVFEDLYGNAWDLLEMKK